MFVLIIISIFIQQIKFYGELFIINNRILLIFCWMNCCYLQLISLFTKQIVWLWKWKFFKPNWKFYWLDLVFGIMFIFHWHWTPYWNNPTYLFFFFALNRSVHSKQRLMIRKSSMIPFVHCPFLTLKSNEIHKIKWSPMEVNVIDLEMFKRIQLVQTISSLKKGQSMGL